MAFPFDLLDLFIPEIAHWMAGKSTSEKRRFRNAGVGLLAIGVLIFAGSFFYPFVFSWIFNDLVWAYFISLMFSVCGLGLLACLVADKKISKHTAPTDDETRFK